MSQELDTIAIVEDDNYFYWEMLPFLEPLNIGIQRANNQRDAMILIDELSENIFWVIDGNFPKFKWERVFTL